MRLYIIVESFGPENGNKWASYCEWRGLRLERFDSIDGILRPSLFRPESDEDWQHVGREAVHYLTDLTYARAKRRELARSVLVGISFDAHDEHDSGFKGYDLIDGSYNVSLLTNWGSDHVLINDALGPNGLVKNWEAISRICQHVLAEHPEDGHVKGCQIVSIYGVDG
jgi:hypothetical protein